MVYSIILYADITVLIRSTGLYSSAHPHCCCTDIFIFYSYLYDIIYYYIASGKRPTGCPLTRVSCLSKSPPLPPMMSLCPFTADTVYVYIVYTH